METNKKKLELHTVDKLDHPFKLNQKSPADKIDTTDASLFLLQ